MSSLASQLSPDEMKLLAKLEEQNRLLEKDSKSLSSVNGVLQSPSSLRNLYFDEDTWDQVVKEWEDWSKNKVGQLKELIRRGIPAHLRAHLWQLLCDAQNVADRQRYSQLLKTSSPSETLIRRDMTRILPQHQLFQSLDSTSQEALFNVLKAYSALDREIGYCQGSVFIVGMLITQMSEEEAFCVFVRLMKDFQLRELYRSTMTDLGCCIYQLDSMIQEQLPDLHSHFQTQGFHTSIFSSTWFLHILLSSLSVAAAPRIFDIFMCEGLEIVFRVGLAMLYLKQAELIKFDVEGMTQCLQNSIKQYLDPDNLIKAAYQIKYIPRRMKELRKYYASIKAKELEEQEELNRCSEKLVSQLKTELETTRLNATKSFNTLKEMQAKILQKEENSTGPDEDCVEYLQKELISCRLREAEALTRLKELKLHVKHMDEKWQNQQAHGGGQQKGGSVQNILQVELLSAQLKETHSKAALIESRHRLLQLQTENELTSNQLKRIEAHVNSQREHLQELTSQNQHLHNQLQ
ncbi:ecotropic viral integration site 5 protein homolog isoform X2 [Triplophysa dalaica]|uniref:ecotropic viral integration site 5 protein homolog isoform X2 n=1 Tax=Triplophysa dalaica TaxID=1582913 RepID=UPI0024E027DC|nr:ecotropic viral integration site 5 protein homolog isoform X2 [Triplophysa dalaica]